MAQTDDQKQTNTVDPHAFDANPSVVSRVNKAKADKQKEDKPDAGPSLKDIWKKMTPSQRSDFLNRPDLTAEELMHLGQELGIDGIHPGTSVEAAPSLMSIRGLKEKALQLAPKAANWLPTAGGMAGGVAGEGAAALTDSPELLMGAKAVGSGIGGGLGEVARQGVEHVMGQDDPDYTWSQRLGDIRNEALGQGLTEYAFTRFAKAIRPTLDKSIDKIVAAGDLGAANTQDLEKVMNDLAKTEKLAGNKVFTIGDFRTLLKTAKNDIGNQVDLSMQKPIKDGGKMVPLRDAKANVNPVFNRIHNLINVHPSEAVGAVGDNPVKRKAIEHRALQYAIPRSYGELTDRRIVLNNHLRALYDLPKGEQRAFLLQHPDLEIDKAEADAIRDIIYPEMDTASGHPLGTTQTLQNKRGAIMSLENAFQEQEGKLHAATRAEAGKNLLERGNISTYGANGRPGFAIHRLGSFLKTPDPEHAASRKLARAFGNTILSKTAKKATTPIGQEIMSLPMRDLFNPGNAFGPDLHVKDQGEDQDEGQDDSTPSPQSMNLQGVSGLIEQAKQHKPTGGIEKIVDIPGVQSPPVQQQASIKITHRFNPQSGEIEAA